MSDQLQSAIHITQARITELEDELRREREFMARLVPKGVRPKQQATNGSNWRAVFAAVAATPMRREHIIDFIDERAFTMTRGATGAWLNDRTKRGYLKRDKGGTYSATPEGHEWFKASSSQPS